MLLRFAGGLLSVLILLIASDAAAQQPRMGANPSGQSLPPSAITYAPASHGQVPTNPPGQAFPTAAAGSVPGGNPYQSAGGVGAPQPISAAPAATQFAPRQAYPATATNLQAAVPAQGGYYPAASPEPRHGLNRLPVRLAQQPSGTATPDPDADTGPNQPAPNSAADAIGADEAEPSSDPEQAGSLSRFEDRISALEKAAGEKKTIFPIVRLSGFFHLDQGTFSQSSRSLDDLGNIQNGVGFRRARLQAVGSVSEFTNYSIEMDFAIAGRPSFMDVWGEQRELPFLGTVRIGQFRQPTTMDALTSIRHLEFLERNLAFQGLDPFRRVGIMAYDMSEDERTTWAYSVYATGFSFFNNGVPAFSDLGDTRFGTQIGDKGGVSSAIRLTHLLYYDEPSEGRYLLHIGGGYNFSEQGGIGTTGAQARAYQSRPIPEFFVGDPTAGLLTSAGVPVVADTGRFLADYFQFYHGELGGSYGPAHFQSEIMASSVKQLGGGTVYYPGAYCQCGYFLTGENVGYNKPQGVLDYNVAPFSDFFGLGRGRRIGGWGAWEVAFRWSYLDLSATNINPANRLLPVVGPPPSPNPAVVNETTLALNWWWNKFTRVQLNWIHSMPKYNGIGAAPFDILASRFQVEF